MASIRYHDVMCNYINYSFKARADHRAEKSLTINSAVKHYVKIMHAPEVVIQLQNDLGRYLARTTKVVISLVPPYVTMCKVYCQVTFLWKNAERAGRGQCQLTVQMNDWNIRTTTFLGLTCLWVSFLAKKKNSENGKKKKKKKKKKKRPVQPEGLWQFSWCCLHSQGFKRRIF